MARHFHAHTHEHFSISQLADHVRKYHESEDDVDVWEPHGDDVHVNATVKVSNRDSDSARIDVHPWAVPLFKDAEVVFASIEGVQKADAILTAIRRHNLAASVYSVPSVTLWNDPNTERFVRCYLAGKTVIVVPDADWEDEDKKGAVENQARIYHGRLLGLGVERVHVAAAPLEFMLATADKGIDDFLGKGGTLQQMTCIDVAPPDWKVVLGWVNEAVLRVMGNSPNPKYAKTLADMITSLSMFASVKEGKTVRASQGCVANVLGVTQQAIAHRLSKLTELGAIEYDGSLASGRNFFGGYDWENQPAIRIVPPELMATPLPKRALVDVLGEVFFKGRT